MQQSEDADQLRQQPRTVRRPGSTRRFTTQRLTFGSPVASPTMERASQSLNGQWSLSDEKPEPVEHNEAAVTEKNAVDFPDAERDLVLPAYQAAPPVTAASAAPVTPVVVKQEPLWLQAIMVPFSAIS